MPLINEFPCTTCPDCTELTMRDCVDYEIGTGYPSARILATKGNGAQVEGVTDNTGMATLPDSFTDGANFFNRQSKKIKIEVFPDLTQPAANCWIISIL